MLSLQLFLKVITMTDYSGLDMEHLLDLQDRYLNPERKVADTYTDRTLDFNYDIFDGVVFHGAGHAEQVKDEIVKEVPLKRDNFP